MSHLPRGGQSWWDAMEGEWLRSTLRGCDLVCKNVAIPLSVDFGESTSRKPRAATASSAIELIAELSCRFAGSSSRMGQWELSTIAILGINNCLLHFTEAGGGGYLCTYCSQRAIIRGAQPTGGVIHFVASPSVLA